MKLSCICGAAEESHVEVSIRPRTRRIAVYERREVETPPIRRRGRPIVAGSKHMEDVLVGVREMAERPADSRVRAVQEQIDEYARRRAAFTAQHSGSDHEVTEES